LYGARTPAPLLRAVSRAIATGRLDATRIRIRFIGRVTIPDVHPLVNELGLGAVVDFITHVPRRAALQEMVDASALLIIQPGTAVSVPAKLYEYMAAGPAILALTDPEGETGRTVRDHWGGVVVGASDEAAIEEAVIGLIHRDRTATTSRDTTAYDGRLRAAETAAILAAVATRRGPALMPRVDRRISPDTPTGASQP
jgi:glycosyltransferase involved in cell wall biosynthesis